MPAIATCAVRGRKATSTIHPMRIYRAVDHRGARSPHDALRVMPTAARPQTVPKSVHPQAPRKCAKHEWGVGSGDEEIDRRMVEHPEDTLGGGGGQSVVKRRGGIQQDQRGAENAEAKKLPGIAVLRGGRDQHEKTRQAGQQAGAMRDAVCDLFSAGQRAMRLQPGQIGHAYALG